MALDDKKKDALMAKSKQGKGTGEESKANSDGGIVDKFKGKALNNAKNSLLNGADKATDGTASKVQQGIRLARRVAQIAMQIIRSIIGFVINVVHLLFNPITWWILLSVVVLLIILAIFQVYGPTTFKYDPGNEPIAALEEIEDGKKGEIASLTFSQKTKVNNNVSAYLGKLFEKNKGKLTYINKTIPEGCDSKCILGKVNSGEWGDIEIGAWKLKGDNAKKLLESSINSKKSWNTSEAQMQGIISAINSSKDKALTASDGDVSDSIKAVNNLLNISMTDAEVEQMNDEVKTAADSIGDKVEKVKRIGQGHCLGRTEGGTAIEDDSCTGDDDDSSGSIDTSDLIEFLEEYCSPTHISSNGSDGSAQATEKMKAGKKKAEQNGGADPLGPLFASCDRLVAAALKATKIDTEYPWGNVAAQLSYVQSHPDKWKKVSAKDRKSGDVIIWYGGGAEHTAIYGVNKSGKKMVYQASYFQYIPEKTETFDSATNDPDQMPVPPAYWRFVGKKG